MKTKAQREASALRRLKQRIANVMHRPEDKWYRTAANQCIDAWHAAERKRGGR